jgi:DNA-binding CsgD family transcriptional regulator
MKSLACRLMAATFFSSRVSLLSSVISVSLPCWVSVGRAEAEILLNCLTSILSTPAPKSVIVCCTDGPEEVGANTNFGQEMTISLRLDDVVAAFRAGVNGYFAEVTSCEVFAKSVELVMMGEVVFPPAFLSFALVDDHHVSNRASSIGSSGAMLTAGTIDPRLSPRERSIMRCLIEGDSNKCIARKVEIAEATVKVHIKAILRKIQVQNRTQAAIWGVNHAFLAQSSDISLAPSAPGANGELPIFAGANGKSDLKASNDGRHRIQMNGCNDTSTTATSAGATGPVWRGGRSGPAT